jgi:hypothetical protein
MLTTACTVGVQVDYVRGLLRHNRPLLRKAERETGHSSPPGSQRRQYLVYHFYQEFGEQNEILASGEQNALGTFYD